MGTSTTLSEPGSERRPTRFVAVKLVPADPAAGVGDQDSLGGAGRKPEALWEAKPVVA